MHSRDPSTCAYPGFAVSARGAQDDKFEILCQTGSVFPFPLSHPPTLYWPHHFTTMANILYGVNGEGSGHSTRAKEVITHLQRQVHRVHVVSFDRGLRNLSESFSVTEIFGLRITYVNNRVRYKRTVASNLIKAPRAARSLKQLTRLIEEEKINLVITDFEPLTCHAAHRKRLPVIAID